MSGRDINVSLIKIKAATKSYDDAVSGGARVLKVRKCASRGEGFVRSDDAQFSGREKPRN